MRDSTYWRLAKISARYRFSNYHSWWSVYNMAWWWFNTVESSPARRMYWLAEDDSLLATRHSLLDKKTLSSFPINTAVPPKKCPGIIIETGVECSTAKKTWPLKTWSVMLSKKGKLQSRTAVPDPRDHSKPKLCSRRILNTSFHIHVAGPPKNFTSTVFQAWYQSWYLLDNTSWWIARTAHK